MAALSRSPTSRRVVDAAKEPPRLSDADLRRASLDRVVAFAADRGGRVQHHRVPLNEQVEQVTDGGQVDLLGGGRAGQAVEVAPDIGRRHFVQPSAAVVSPLEKSTRGALVAAARVRVADRAVEVLVPGEARRGPRSDDDQGWLARRRLASARRVERLGHQPSRRCVNSFPGRWDVRLLGRTIVRFTHPRLREFLFW